MDIDLDNILNSPDETIHQFDYFENIDFCHEESKTNKINNTLFDHIDKTVCFNKSIRPGEIKISLSNIELKEEKSSTNLNTDNDYFIIQNELNQMNSVSLNVGSEVNLNEDMKIEMEENVLEASYLSNKTLSYIEEFDRFLKKVENKGQKSEFHNTTETPLLTHTEREDLLNSITTKGDMDYGDLLVDTMVYENSEIPLPIITLRNIDEIINNTESDESHPAHNDHNYAMVLSSDNSKELSIKSENKNNGQGKMIVDIVTETSELDLLNNTDNDIIHEANVALGKQIVSKKITEQLDERLTNKENDMVKNKKRVDLYRSTTDEDKLPTKAADLKVNETKTVSVENVNSEEDSDCEGYNSSDFEFIDESEACIEGIVVKSNVKAKSFKFKRPEVVPDTYKGYNSNHSRFYDRADANHRYNLRRNFDSENERHCRNNHVIPQGENYLELFAQPWTMYHYEAENKAFHSSQTMHVEVDNIGFNVSILQRLHEEHKVDHGFEQEAKETAKKIISMYPMQNRKRRRRF